MANDDRFWIGRDVQISLQAMPKVELFVGVVGMIVAELHNRAVESSRTLELERLKRFGAKQRGARVESPSAAQAELEERLIRGLNRLGLAVTSVAAYDGADALISQLLHQRELVPVEGGKVALGIDQVAHAGELGRIVANVTHKGPMPRSDPQSDLRGDLVIGAFSRIRRLPCERREPSASRGHGPTRRLGDEPRLDPAAQKDRSARGIVDALRTHLAEKGRELCFESLRRRAAYRVREAIRPVRLDTRVAACEQEKLATGELSHGREERARSERIAGGEDQTQAREVEALVDTGDGEQRLRLGREENLATDARERDGARRAPVGRERERPRGRVEAGHRKASASGSQPGRCRARKARIFSDF